MHYFIFNNKKKKSSKPSKSNILCNVKTTTLSIVLQLLTIIS